MTLAALSAPDRDLRMGKTAREKRPASAPPSGAQDGLDASATGTVPEASTAAEPAEPLERARLQAEVARQRVRIAKDELKRARKRLKEAKREAKRARKQAAATRKVWKKARKAHRANRAPEGPVKRKPHSRALKGTGRGAKRKSTRRRRAQPAVAKSSSNGDTPAAPATPSTET